MKEFSYIVDVQRVENVGTHEFVVTAESLEEATEMLDEAMREYEEQLNNKYDYTFRLEPDPCWTCEHEDSRDGSKGIDTTFDVNDDRLTY